MKDSASIEDMCLMSAPAAKKPSKAEVTIMTLTSPARSAASMAACSPSRIGTPRALAGGRSSVTHQIPGLSRRQLTTCVGAVTVLLRSARLRPSSDRR